jgi:DNA invertase Pin-like site-specific DNA recombinase
MVTERERKISPRHHERLAVVYVRQSTAQQVQRNKESTQAQYGLVDLARRHGWVKERILVIDEDLGQSGASAESRTGFQRLLSEVALDRVGVIIGIEMSRLARSCKDWYQLLELCAIFGTLICAGTQGNDVRSRTAHHPSEDAARHPAESPAWRVGDGRPVRLCA